MGGEWSCERCEPFASVCERSRTPFRSWEWHLGPLAFVVVTTSVPPLADDLRPANSAADRARRLGRVLDAGLELLDEQWYSFLTVLGGHLAFGGLLLLSAFPLHGDTLQLQRLNLGQRVGV